MWISLSAKQRFFFLSSPKHPDRFKCTLSFLFNRYRGQSGRVVKVVTHLSTAEFKNAWSRWLLSDIDHEMMLDSTQGEMYVHHPLCPPASPSPSRRHFSLCFIWVVINWLNILRNVHLTIFFLDSKSAALRFLPRFSSNRNRRTIH